MISVLWLILLLPIGPAVWLVSRGVRGGRVGDHPVCCRCEFDLFGSPTGTTVCGECGGSLTMPDSVAIGHRQRRPAFIVSGVLILLVTLLAGGGMLSSIHWLHYAPTRFVVQRSTSLSAPRRSPAILELDSRVSAGTLGPTDTNLIADTGLAYQADTSKPWDADWGSLLEKLQGNGKLSSARWTRYLSQAAQGFYTLKIRARVRRGDPLPYIIQTGLTRAGPSGGLSIVASGLGLSWPGPHGAVSLNGGVLGTGPSLIEGSSSLGYGTSSVGSNISSADFPQDMAEGLQHMQLSGTFQIRLRGGGTSPIASGPVDLAADFTLLSADQPSVKIVDDPSLAALIQKSLRANIKSSSSYLSMVNVDGPPVGISFNVLVRANGKEIPIGSFACPAGTKAHGYGMGGNSVPKGLSTVDVIFRSNPSPALNSIDTFEMWKGEVVLKDVPVK